MKVMNRIIKNKSGNAIFLVFAVIMCVFFPIMGVIYDVGRYRMYQQDMKNAQELAGVACIGVSGGSIGVTRGGGLGAFDKNECAHVAYQSAAANLGLKTANSSGVDVNAWQGYIQKFRTNNGLVECTNNSFAIEVKLVDDHHSQVQIKGLCYKPLFLKANLLNFQTIKNNPYRIGVDFGDKKGYPVEVQPTVFSAVYNKRN